MGSYKTQTLSCTMHNLPHHHNGPTLGVASGHFYCLSSRQHSLDVNILLLCCGDVERNPGMGNVSTVCCGKRERNSSFCDLLDGVEPAEIIPRTGPLSQVQRRQRRHFEPVAGTYAPARPAPFNPPTYAMLQVINRNGATVTSATRGVGANRRTTHRFCPTLRNANGNDFGTSNDIWMCNSCWELSGRRVAFLQPNAIAIAQCRRNHINSAAFSELTCFECAERVARDQPLVLAPGAIAAVPICVPAWACHDMDECPRCSASPIFRTTCNYLDKSGALAARGTKTYGDWEFAAPTTPLGVFLVMVHAQRTNIATDEESEYTEIMSDFTHYAPSPLVNAAHRIRVEHVIGTRLQLTSDGSSIAAEATSAAARVIRDVPRGEIAMLVAESMGTVASIIAEVERRARETTASLDLSRRLALVEAPGIRATYTRFLMAYYHARAGPHARSWLPSFRRLTWAVRAANE